MPRPAPLRAAVRLTVGVLAWTVVLAGTATVAAAVLVPRVAGATPYAVLTGSMRPDLPPGALVVVRPVAAEDLAIGSVVTYQLVSGEPTVVTHRVVSVGYDGRGERRLRTQGDANEEPDAAWVRPEQVRGELWYAVPLLGHAHTWLSVQDRERLVRHAGFGLVGYAGWMFLGAVRGRRRERRTDVTTEDAPEPAPAGAPA